MYISSTGSKDNVSFPFPEVTCPKFKADLKQNNLFQGASIEVPLSASQSCLASLFPLHGMLAALHGHHSGCSLSLHL